MFTRTKKFNEWAADLSRANPLKNTIFPGNVALIEVYRDIIEDPEDAPEVDMIVGKNADGSFVRKSEKMDVIVKPIAKVLAVGNAISEDFKGIKKGDLVTLPDSIKRTVTNPEYLSFLQMQRSNAEPKIPKGMMKNVSKFSKEWVDYMFQIDKFAPMMPLDSVTFLVHLNSMTIQTVHPE